VRISAIITTYNRLQILLRALHSLQQQTLPDFEILVVDNAADSEVERMVAEFNRTARINACYIAHNFGGNAGARNRGALEAKGELLVYTDDDLTFDPQWLAAYDREFSCHAEMMAAGGCVQPVWEQQPPAWLLDYIGPQKVFPILALMAPSEHFTISQDGYFFGCNMAIRRSVFEWTGFHPELYGTQTIGDGESGLNQEIAAQSGLIGYVPDAIVYHHIPASRMTVDYIRKWAWHLGGSQMYGRWWNRKRSARSLTKEVLIIIRQYLRMWIKDPMVRRRQDPDAIDIQFQASLGWCKIYYIWWMLTDTKVQRALDMKDFRP